MASRGEDAPTTDSSTDCTLGHSEHLVRRENRPSRHRRSAAVFPLGLGFSREWTRDETAPSGVGRGTRGDAAHRAPASPRSVAGTVSYTNTSTTEPPRAPLAGARLFSESGSPRSRGSAAPSLTTPHSPFLDPRRDLFETRRRRTHTPCFVCKESILSFRTFRTSSRGACRRSEA